MSDTLFLLTGMTSDEVWIQANDFVDHMPEGLIEKHRGKLAGLFAIHAKTLQAEIKRRAPEETFMVDALDYVLKERIQKGATRESLRDLAIGVIAHLPFRETMDLEPCFEDMLGPTTDKNIVLYSSVQQRGVGIMPATFFYIFNRADQRPEVFYKENLARIFPDPDQIKVTGPS